MTDAPEEATTIAVDSDTDAGSGTQVPTLLLCTLGLPLFLTIAWFFMQFTGPNRFGGVVLPKNFEEGEE